MAKRKRQTRWEPHRNDAINLATIRWFSIMIEAKSIELYGTDQNLYPKLEAALKDALSAVVAVKPIKDIAAPGDCPPGWVPCGDECAPKCLNE